MENKYSKMADLNPVLLVITLHVKGLNSPTKGRDWQKQTIFFKFGE